MWSTKRYVIELGGAMLLYGALLVGSNAVQRGLRLHGGPAAAVSLVPMLGCIAALVAIMRGIRRMDELGRRIHFEAIAFAFAATALVTFGWGFVENDGMPRLRAFWVWPLMSTFWIVGLMFANRRYWR
jgi:hypothetical protein